jgi:DNA repair protein RecO (recombination protein O)
MATSRRAAAHLDAYVLHRYDWSETSLILDLFTREQGRLAVAAKGAKRPYSQLRPVLLPFQHIHVALGRVPKADANPDEPTHEVQNLRSAEWAGGAAMLTGAALFSGFYLNELLMRLTARHDPHPVLFDAYAQTLPALVERDDTVVEAALRAFEIVLLKELGVLPELSVETLTLALVRDDGRYALLPDAGVAAARGGDAAVDGSILIGLQAALEHGSQAALQSRCAEALPELKPMLRALLHYHLGSPVMRTRQVMLDVQSLTANPSSP